MSEIIQERVRLPFDQGELDGEIAYPLDAPLMAVLLLNPHPYMGGKMDNNLIKRLAADLAGKGMLTLRFDYRGVGESDGAPPDIAKSMSEFWARGQAPEDPLMIEDARIARRWLASQAEIPMLLIGYSFGAYVAEQIASAKAPGMILISPTIKQHDFSGLEQFEGQKLIIASDNDFATPLQETIDWGETLPGRKAIRCFRGAEHFYRGLEGEVSRVCVEFAWNVIKECEVLS